MIAEYGRGTSRGERKRRAVTPRAATRSAALRYLACVLILLLTPQSARAQAITVTLLGTGSPEPALDRFGPATLVEAGGQRFLFDAGRGAAQRVWQLGVRVGDIDRVFLTHLHSDHVVGVPDIWLSGYLMPARFGGRRMPLLVWGPTGTAAMVAGLRVAYAEDIRIRSARGVPDSATRVIGRDVQQGLVYDHNGVKVTAFRVEHGEPPIPAYGYRLEYAGRSVVISGDTRPSENLIHFAVGADLLIHEVMAAETASLPPRYIGVHTSPEDAGRVFARVRPRLAVFTHVSLVSPPERRPALLERIVPRVRTTYGGRVVIGEDLMTIVVGDSVEVRPTTVPAR